MTHLVSELEKFVAIRTVAGDEASNNKGINFIINFLEEIGFTCEIEGDSPHFQPVIVAKYSNGVPGKKVVLYSHYDVEIIRKPDQWETPPFEIVRKDNRLYGRGTADNKAILLARMLAIKEMVLRGAELPNILWIIQGEEEVAGNTPFEVIPRHFEEFGAKLYVEETGYQKHGKRILFYLPDSPKKPSFLKDLNHAVFGGKAHFEFRAMSKFTTCPFLSNIPSGGHYIGFGPNDTFANIHRPNESMDQKLLENHIPTFQKFMEWVTLTDL